MLSSLCQYLHDLIYKNRRFIKPNNTVEIPACTRKSMKKVTIKVGGRNNRLILAPGVTLRNCEIRLDGENNLIELGNNSRISSGKVYLRNTQNQHIRIGADTTVEGAYLLVDEAASIDIGRDCMFSTDIIMRIGDKHSILNRYSKERVNQAQNIVIGDRVWIGRDVQVLKGVVLHPETIVGTRSLVTKAFDESHCVIAGVPAKIVKRDVIWDRDLL